MRNRGSLGRMRKKWMGEVKSRPAGEVDLVTVGAERRGRTGTGMICVSEAVGQDSAQGARTEGKNQSQQPDPVPQWPPSTGAESICHPPNSENHLQRLPG